ncbi:hypothetical protein Cgig2_017483 [Carnegiea gigantea]|uniref:ER membrane protein complex subunit 7 beta-sandwich domain-containing protein n=1 Tax=Carnegiea gigantea TaxID=171969 RepID=A0A9Q1GIN4_9CARY|nr:hypothetical protein Cgig2_017483 [Carnegiea gigantea]
MDVNYHFPHSVYAYDFTLTLYYLINERFLLIWLAFHRADTGTRGYGKTSNVKVILNGGQRVTFLRPDGYFSLYPTYLLPCSFFVKHFSIFHFTLWSYNVSAGTHLIEVAAIGYYFSPVRVDISARNPGKVQAALTETRRGLSELALEPLREEEYYEKREPFSIMSLVKSPMGLMVGFMVIVVFLMPKLMGKSRVSFFINSDYIHNPLADPEEIKRAQEEMRNNGQGVPSLANFLAGAQRN